MLALPDRYASQRRKPARLKSDDTKHDGQPNPCGAYVTNGRSRIRIGVRSWPSGDYYRTHLAVVSIHCGLPVRFVRLCMWKNVQIERIVIDVDRPLGVLVRSMLGLDRNSAKSAFTQFLSETPLHPDQIIFLDEVVND